MNIPTVEYPTTHQSLKNLRHITSADAALAIIFTRTYRTSFEFGHYDGGMNLLGVQGEFSNSLYYTRAPGQEHTRAAELVCSWDGLVTQPMTILDPGARRQLNTLFDYDGSGPHFRNNDPRYILPLGSEGIRVDQLVIHHERCFIEALYAKARGFKGWAHRHGRFRQHLADQAQDALNQINTACARGEVTLKID